MGVGEGDEAGDDVDDVDDDDEDAIIGGGIGDKAILDLYPLIQCCCSCGGVVFRFLRRLVCFPEPVFSTSKFRQQNKIHKMHICAFTLATLHFQSLLLRGTTPRIDTVLGDNNNAVY